MTLTKFNASPSTFTTYFGSDEFLRSLLLPLGKEPTDMLVGLGAATEEASIGLLAIRVRGVAGEDVTNALLPALAGAVDATFPPDITMATEDIGGQQVLVVRRATTPDTTMAFYSVGEVMFLISVEGGDPDGTIAEVLAELP